MPILPHKYNCDSRVILGLIIGVVIFFFAAMPLVVAAQEPDIAVVYPQIRKPYKLIFDEIIVGVESGVGADVAKIRLFKDEGEEKIQKWLKNKKTPQLIALGHRALSTLTPLSPNIRLVFGSVIVSPELVNSNDIMVNHTPAPSLLFAKLKLLLPKITTVHVVINPKANDWLLDYAKVAAAQHNITLSVQYASSLKESGLIYQKLAKNISRHTEAIWLPQDRTTINNQVTLPLLLENAWRRRLVLFSSSLNHVDKGVLFALYPDNKKLGLRLGVLAKEVQQGMYSGPKFMLLKDLKAAVNIRTAKHIDLNLDKRQRKSFDLVFPKR